MTWWWAGPEWRHKMTNQLVYSGIHIIWTIFRVCPVRWNLETCIGNDLDWKHTNLLEPKNVYWKYTNEAGNKNRALKTVGNKVWFRNNPLRLETSSVDICFQLLTSVSKLCNMFPISFYCFETHLQSISHVVSRWNVSKVCFQNKYYPSSRFVPIGTVRGSLLKTKQEIESEVHPQGFFT